MEKLRKNTRTGIRALLLAVLASRAFAEPVPALTWEDCVRLAARKNPDLLSAARAREAGRSQYRGSFNSIFPHLSLTNSYTDSRRSAGAGTWQAQGAASLDLVNPANWASIRTAAAGYAQADANARVTSATALLNLYKAFAAMLYAQEQKHVLQGIRSIWKINADLIALRYRSGRESKGNQMRTDAELLQAEADLAQAGRDLHTAQQSLSQVLGEERFQALQVTGTWTTGALPPEPLNMDASINQLPKILAQKAVVEQARASLALARTPLFPALSLNYNRGAQGGSEFPDSPYWTFSGLLSYPLFGAGPTSAYYAAAAARRNLERAQFDLESIRNQARTDLESAWSVFAQAMDQIGVQRAFLQAAAQRREESDVRYQNGLMSFEEWRLVVIDYVNFQKSFLRSQRDLILAEGGWRFAAGEPLMESGD